VKSNWNATLERWTRCVPCSAREMVYAAVVENADVVCTYDGWEDADSLTGLDNLEDGSLEIEPTISDKITHTTQDGYYTDLDHASPYSAAQIQWKGDDPRDFEIHKVKAWLHPKRTGDPQTVARWGCQIMGLQRVERGRHVIVPLSTIIWVDESGSIAHEVTFDFTGVHPRPRPKTLVPNDPDNNYRFPTSYILIYAAQSDGSPADNCGWGRDSAQPSKTDSDGDVLKGYTLTKVTTIDGFGLYGATDDSMTPYITIQEGGYTQQTVEFTNNNMDLGATPASADEVVFVVQGSERSGTSLTASARIPAGSWVEVKDGQTAADVGLAANRYYEMKCDLDPDTNGVVSPILRRLGVEDVALMNLSSVVDVKEIHRQVDPVTLKTYISSAKLVAIQDGVRDWNDAITSLLSTYYVGQIQFRIYWGHPDLDRQYWMEMGTFIEPIPKAIDGAMEITAFSPLALVKAKLPRFNTGTSSRAPLTYAGETLKDVYEDLLDSQIELPGRFRGPGIEDDTTTISRRINEELEAKDLLDAIAYCDGSAVGESQGRVKAFNMYGDKAVVAVFPSKTIKPSYVSPGYEHRIPQWTVKYGWSEDENRYLGEAYFAHGSSLTNLGRASLNDTQDPGDEVMKLLDDPSPPAVPDLVDTIGGRGVKFFGPGLLTLGFNSVYAYPELELGDLVAVETDRFVAVDPNTANAVRGRLWILGVIVDHDKRGENFVVWCRDYADIFGSATAGSITVGFERARAKVYHDTDQTFTGSPYSWDVPWNSEAFDHGDVHSTTPPLESRLTVPPGAGGSYKATLNATYSGLAGGGANWWAYFVLRTNGGAYRTHRLDGNSPATGSFTIELPLELDAADYVFLRVLTNTGVTVTMNCSTEDESSLALTRIGK